ncbi:type II toxin-antitoxin system VapC family toxin [archaeon]|jgi:tRNA(fMet)-specific endonuclease VapC|nr:type II toxin-antitoxin system VapC family toxin [archaeon]MBT6762010.1 type II toxin-antitoxin system VapC family toxin [archaeon]
MIADSTILIDFLRNKPEAVQKIRNAAILYTTEINVFEILTGVFFAKENINQKKERANAMFSNMIVLPLNRKASNEAAKIAGALFKKGTPIESTDSLIAGIAITNGITKILTKNKKHFEKIPGIKVITY